MIKSQEFSVPKPEYCWRRRRFITDNKELEKEPGYVSLNPVSKTWVLRTRVETTND